MGHTITNRYLDAVICAFVFVFATKHVLLFTLPSISSYTVHVFHSVYFVLFPMFCFDSLSDWLLCCYHLSVHLRCCFMYFICFIFFSILFCDASVFSLQNFQVLPHLEYWRNISDSILEKVKQANHLVSAKGKTTNY